MQRRITFAIAALVAASCAVFGQSAAKPPEGPRGDLTAIDATRGVLTIKTTAGAEEKASIAPTTEFLLVEAGAKSLAGAEKISLQDVKVGDRVWARGATENVAARQVVVISAGSIEERNRRDAQDWMRRGVMGEVKAVDAGTRRITVESYRGGEVSVTANDATVVRRLAEGATDLSHSESIALGDIQVGNQIAVRGERGPEGTAMTAETIIAGRFPRPARGRVTAVDAAKGEVTIATMAGQPMTLAVPEGALVRKLTPRPPAEGGGPGGSGAAPGGAAPAGRTPGARRGPGGFAFALGDRTELDRRTTEIKLADVAPGDFVFAVVEPGTTDRVRVLVKFELPAGFTPRNQGGPGMQVPQMPDMGGDGDMPF